MKGLISIEILDILNFLILSVDSFRVFVPYKHCLKHGPRNRGAGTGDMNLYFLQNFDFLFYRFWIF